MAAYIEVAAGKQKQVILLISIKLNTSRPHFYRGITLHRASKFTNVVSNIHD
jgi:hypothetical protein